MQTDATMLANNFQHCWILHFASFCTCCCAKFETGQTFSYVQTDATTPIIIGWHQCCTCTLLNTCIALCNWTQHCWPTISQHCWMLGCVQTDATLLDVTCCVRLHTLLHVVGCCCVSLRKA